MLSVPTIREAKNRLKQRGLIDFKAPDKASKSLDGQTKYLFPTVKKNCTDTCTDTLTDTCTDTCTDTLTDTCTNNKLNKTKLNKTILNPHNPLSENLKIFENPELPKLPEKDWREDYEVYREQLRKAFVEIVTPEYIAEHQEYYSQNLDIYKTIEKACVDFWSLPAGWQHKKKSKTKVIDWKATFNNMLSSKFNHVYKPWTN
jgi:hypothetical protein